ncbi:phage shock protein B [Polymorphobacter multimanifer]|uniref:Phage shock protein B n=1 Tax=Polymorphobacter multimanifer TaxID=1070431 RepID=A0A841L3M8_9SPHN|nr:envelope stress response membrane protein PspB [Polymorphobacter multimanifer]MBB6227267.1 phage shock protein B [Polymorphobacter multimanifer]
MEDFFTIAVVLGILFIGLPWLVLHYLTRWKSGQGISQQDEVLLDDLHEMARRLDDRLHSIERIIAADDPNWKDGRLADSASSNRSRLSPADEPENLRRLR